MLRSKLGRLRGQPGKDPGATSVTEVWYNVINREALIHYKNFSEETVVTDSVWLSDSPHVEYNVDENQTIKALFNDVFNAISL